ncbi:histidine phosphatase family protein [Streptomyces sp. Ru73]|uniref:histidine phosphatase family protein n=1 Tax=Streptomyces sp. Ru73 TaxID=2080748 RepID=UPI000CDD0AEF|nr:histidine phosphatase family protein [Streptomyces sp. Ru73]POX37500.1 histidine phosphatase family protein [Streptomyces sp. Ru73]
MRLLLIRHGQTPSNVGHLLDTGIPGPGLTELGEQQAAALPERLADEKIDVLYASTMVRTQRTAEPLARARGLEIVVRDGIREITAGDLEMRGDAASNDQYQRVAFSWPAGKPELRMPGGENGVEMLARYDAVIEEIAGSGVAAAAVVSHGAAIRTWTAARARNVDADFAIAHPLPNTAVVVLEGDPETGWTVVTWSDLDIPATEPQPGH